MTPHTTTPQGGRIARAASIYGFLALAALVTLFPLIWTIIGSFKPGIEVLLPTIFPRDPTLENYANLLGGQDFYRYFFNSVVIALCSIAGNVLLCSMVGYALAKLDFPGKRLVLAAVLITIMVPGVVMFVPLFITVNGLGLANNYGGMIVPFLVGAGGVFLLRQFLLDIPDELLEAARIDGAGEFRIFFRIVLPLCGPALATIGILTFMSSWNNLLWPLVVAQSKDLYTLPVALAFLSQGDGTINYGGMLAGSVLTIMPIVLVFLFLQRYFISGIATTGIK
ncbi:carbohydrate ABC transporter permease [Nonomuraea angiospora]|uniref:Multiple sugar transport system permease protein n=1 Tax=Nonomuraea angiospora TaxID=46172 RepID=A0ABR9MGS7_9ACTN|nr:carbohydrate ABC transporter permease [Nonomuraea angiospora]MBE1592115.1 multiple sugar transport system permease protein [Nonomuraea angiospora]